MRMANAGSAASLICETLYSLFCVTCKRRLRLNEEGKSHKMKVVVNKRFRGTETSVDILAGGWGE